MVEFLDLAGYRCTHLGLTPVNRLLLPTLLRLLRQLAPPENDARLLDLGCGNGAIAALLDQRGYTVIGVDPSIEAISLAKNTYPEVAFELGSAYDDLRAQYGQFPVVISLEVVEHCYFPRKYASTLFSLVSERGAAIVSTPYHGYLKNLALALSGKMDQHFDPLWDHGHIKFWSRRTLRTVLEEAGFRSVRFHLVGGIGPLAKGMIAVAKR